MRGDERGAHDRTLDYSRPRIHHCIQGRSDGSRRSYEPGGIRVSLAAASRRPIMTNRRAYHNGRRGKDRYVRLPEYLLASAAWQSLDGNSRALYVEIARRYRGPSSNNGKIPYSVREAAKALHVGHSTAQRCFEKLQDRGFIKIGKRSGFSVKGRVATEWLLTEFSDDTTATLSPPTKDFMRWSEPDTSDDRPTTETLDVIGTKP